MWEHVFYDLMFWIRYNKSKIALKTAGVYSRWYFPQHQVQFVMLKFNEVIRLRQKWMQKLYPKFMREPGQFANEEFLTLQHRGTEGKSKTTKISMCAQMRFIVYPNIEEELQEKLYINECFQKIS